ncbi:MAG: pyridoxal phosphate-dependent aminotransferase [Clostridia bacterium]|nr:pyridoxal phosphate-dependent aminotransferase [Clostridia bacterium]MBQ6177837.1 pyridoxal phosphate-dependent aminotransferase [Bacteroidales bacterium]
MPLTVSHRCQHIAPSLTLAIDAVAKEMKAAGEDVVGFGAGEPDFATPAHIVAAAKEALDMGMTRYTPSSGTMELRKAICDKLLRDNDLTYEPADVIVSSGAKHSLFNTFQAILDPGDEVLIPTPCWVSYPEMVRMAGGVPVFVPTTEAEGFIPGYDEIASRINRRTKAFVLTSPSNPCGCVWSRGQLQALADLAVDRKLFVVSDEIYEKLLYDQARHISIAQLGDQIKRQTIVINGLSKAFAMTGWRIGYAAGPREIISAMGAFQSQAASNANAMAQHASAVALNSDQTCVVEMVQEFEKRRDTICGLINAIPGISCRKPQGAFYVMMNIQYILGRRHERRPLTDSMSFADELLKSKKVAVVPGVAFEAEGYCRLSYATSMDNIVRGLERIAEFVGELR